jgi:hypothetical protein
MTTGKAVGVTLLTLLAGGGLAAQRADTLVRVVGRPLHAGVATLQREISIGIADGDEHYMLGAIADVAVSASGDIYIWDASVPAIRMYNGAGKYIRTIGRSGSGPGEYRAGAGLAVAPNGNLLMWDRGTRGSMSTRRPATSSRVGRRGAGVLDRSREAACSPSMPAA